jgi:outer membrane lipoprotein LolB
MRQRPQLCHLVVLCAVVVLSGCVSNKPLNPIDNLDRYQQKLAAVEDWQLKGRINVRVPGESDTVSVTWENNEPNYHIYLRGSLGIGATRIIGQPGQVRMERGGEEPVIRHSAEELLYTELGREIPISDLRYWIRGLPAPKPRPSQITVAEQGTLEFLQQAGWSLQYSDYIAVGPWNMPRKIVAERDDFVLTLYSLRWNFEPGK